MEYMIVILFSALGFIFLSGVLAMVDAAVLSVTRAETEALIVKKKFGATELRSIKEHMTRAVVVIVILTNIVNVFGPVIVGFLATEKYGSSVIGMITALLTVGTILFSEILPKSLGTHYAPTIARVSAPVIGALIIVLYPLVRLLEKLTDLLHTGKRKVGTEEQIKSLVRLGRSSGYIETDEDQLIQRTFVLNDLRAQDAMAPLENVSAVSVDDTVRDAAQVVLDMPYSRYPVFGQNADDVRGMIMSHDVLQALTEGKDNDSVASILRSIPVVSHDMRCDDLLVFFREKRTHLALVKNGDHTQGIVTLEDVLEQLVGNIEDEHDSQRN